jgi:5-methylcytosine-specific restriction endonuclease McrA
MANDPWTRVGAHKRKRIRERFAVMIRAGGVSCPFCGYPIEPGQRWDVDHAVPVGIDVGMVLDVENLRPSHARCNRRAGQRLATAKKRHRAAMRKCPGCDGPIAAGARLCGLCLAAIQ